MGIVSWDESLNVGVEEINDQHKKLIEMINQLHESMKSGQGKEVMGPILTELASYTVTHFATEEKYFQKFKYPETNTHIAEHKAFVGKVSDFKTKFENDESAVTMELIQFLKDWLVKHIKGEDMKYKDFFKENGLK